MVKKTIRDFDLRGKRVLIRVDFNVPLDKNLNLTDDTRIRATLPTIKYALEHGAQVILMSHLGRPEGRPVSTMSLSPAAKRLSELLHQEVIQCSDCIGPRIKEELSRLKDGVSVALLENLRFNPNEEKNDPAFSKALAEHGQVYINDAFGSSHRAHASIEGITKFLPSGAGFLLEKEIQYLGEALKNPKKPFMAILGGSKVSDKIGVVENLISKVDKILIGGAMAYTFLKVQGVGIGSSKFEKDKLDLAKTILEKAKENGVEILLPVDHGVVQKVDAAAPLKVEGPSISPEWLGVDIGPKTVQLFSGALASAKTVVWNGPMGIFEMKPFAKGSYEIALKLSELKGAVTVIGGGDTAACVMGFGLQDKMTHISTGGGASLEYLEGVELPGIAALEDK
ncbi:MAG: phosphoglycerate kinase [Candidatus Omnitrophica bacterium]|nr:phosphoglycerate kinase [Candidatus Omnitrophota bacterium]